MLPSDMNLNIRSGSVGYTNKILLSDGTFSLGKNSKVDTLELAKISHKVVQQPLLIKTRNQLILGLLLTMRKNCLYNLWQVFLQYGLCFSERLNLNIQTLSYDLMVVNPIHGGGKGVESAPLRFSLHNSKTPGDIKKKLFDFNFTLLLVILHILSTTIVIRCCQSNLLFPVCHIIFLG